MNHTRKHGFTLVELMVSMALGMILVGVVAFVFTQSSKLYNATLDEMHGTFVLRAGQDVLARDLRDIMLPINDHTRLKIIAADGGTGPADTLEYTTQGPNPIGETVPLKVRVSIKSGYLVREIYEEGDWSAAGYTPVGPRETDLGGDVISFKVEYAWPTPSGMLFLRDAGTGGANAASGDLFCHFGTGSLGNNTFTAGSPYAGGTPPAALATTLYVLNLDEGGGFAIASPGGSTYGLTDSAPAGGAMDFAVPILPPSLRITIQQQTGVGNRARVRSMQRVLSVAR